ncbi:Sorbosone dehydrogenase-domain-containing protein [Pelagophyceae sp. CCMP2097]|nr:Sorbosone dehydrogenase-domain-containing protein [Pelagophyceae sp. CCMP2097]
MAVLRSLLWMAVLAQAAVPEGFCEEIVYPNQANIRAHPAPLVDPVALAVHPDGRIFVTQQQGDLVVIETDGSKSNFVTVPNVHAVGEAGLLGIALDGGGDVYVYYTHTEGPHNRISKFAADGTETAIFDGLRNLNSNNHMGGAIHFGAGTMLFVSVGDNDVVRSAENHPSQDPESFLGKILEIDVNSPCGPPPQALPCSFESIWASGLRNPFSFTLDGTNVFINYVGENEFEEVNVGAPGANYGWPATEGPDAAGFTAPLGGWIDATPTAAPTDADRAVRFATGLGNLVGIEKGLENDLYYLSRAAGVGVLGRIFACEATCAVATETLPDGRFGRRYSQQLSASSCAGPLVWTASGTLPPGLELSEDGLISARIARMRNPPTTYAFTVTVTDSTQTSATQDLEIRVTRR